MTNTRVVSRRRKQRVAVLRAPALTRPDTDRAPLRAVRGTILDAGPQLLMLWTVYGELRVPLAPETSVWDGGKSSVTALRPGRQAIVRPTTDGLAAERIWLDITRVCGTIIGTGRGMVEVDAGPHRGRRHVIIDDGNRSQVLVRHPRFEPGYLIDLICQRSDDGPRAIQPGGYQPGYRADDVPSRAAPGPLRNVVQGTVTWFDGPPPVERLRRVSRARPAPPAPPVRPVPADEPTDPYVTRPDRVYGGTNAGVNGGANAGGLRATGTITTGRTTTSSPGAGTTTRGTAVAGDRVVAPVAGRFREVRGLAYPAVDPEGAAGGCADAPIGCTSLPYLSDGTTVVLRNDCTRRAAPLPVIECGCAAARFCDRCVECGISPRGRIAELTALSFVDLGGELTAGCFNATLTVG